MDRFNLENPSKETPDEESEEDKLVAQFGREHEQKFLEKLKSQGRDVCEIPDSGDRAGLTLAAMKAGREIIYQARLEQAPFAGYADFLFKASGTPSKLGDYIYIPWDTKLARSTKPYFLIQLCAYAAMLEEMQGVRPERVVVVLGDGTEKPFRTDDFFYHYLSLKNEFLEWMKTFDPARRPEPDPGIDHSPWNTVAEQFFESTDHLSRVAGITRLQIKRLQAQGITTLAGLASAPQARIARMADPTFERLKIQAKLQLSSSRNGKLDCQILRPDLEDPRKGLALLPPPSAGDVFFDMEGFPLFDYDGLEYLFGAVTIDSGKERFHDWWAHDRVAEIAAFTAFVDWTHARWKADPAMHIYHYAPYEVTALRKLMGRHGMREDKVDDLLRNEVFVDLLAVVRQGVRVGVRSYSIKELEPLYRAKARSGEVKTAGGSIVAYWKWQQSGEPDDPARSPLLRAIREYNNDDCSSLRGLADWLRQRQKEADVLFIAPKSKEDDEEKDDPDEKHESEVLAEALRAMIPKDQAASAGDPDRWRITELLAQFLGFHRREDKPVWWELFDRRNMTHHELADDPVCLGDMKRSPTPPVPVKESTGFAYSFDPDQDTKIEQGAKCRFSHQTDIHTEVHEFDHDRGHIVLKLGDTALGNLPGGKPPVRLSLSPFKLVFAGPQREALKKLADRCISGKPQPPAIMDLLRRSRPRVKGHPGGPLTRPGEDPSSAAVRLALGLEESTLCVQGPPGAGKTTTGAMIAAAYIKAGKRVGIVANTHKAVLNLMRESGKQVGSYARFLKVGDDPNDPILAECKGCAFQKDSGKGAAAAPAARLVGGTAWLFSRDDVENLFDVLLVDEAGQMALANLVAMSRCAKNIVLLGDQMQLGQVIQGTHPGESGRSVLDYLLQDKPTIPQDMGIFLGSTWRLHPAICELVSGAFYEGRLFPEAHNGNRVLRSNSSARHVKTESGVLFIPVLHDGNAQASDEEVVVIVDLVRELVGREMTGKDGKPAGPLKLEDILFVAPYNMQVRRLREALGKAARVASVDKFQGQQAPVVIVSMCTSSADLSSRGLEFLFDKRRLNVAISRAWSLAIVVGSPTLATAAAASVDQMNLVNTFCRIVRQGALPAATEIRA